MEEVTREPILKGLMSRIKRKIPSSRASLSFRGRKRKRRSEEESVRRGVPLSTEQLLEIYEKAYDGDYEAIIATITEFIDSDEVKSDEDELAKVNALLTAVKDKKARIEAEPKHAELFEKTKTTIGKIGDIEKCFVEDFQAIRVEIAKIKRGDSSTTITTNLKNINQRIAENFTKRNELYVELRADLDSLSLSEEEKAELESLTPKDIIDDIIAIYKDTYKEYKLLSLNDDLKDQSTALKDLSETIKSLVIFPDDLKKLTDEIKIIEEEVARELSGRETGSRSSDDTSSASEETTPTRETSPVTSSASEETTPTRETSPETPPVSEETTPTRETSPETPSASEETTPTRETSPAETAPAETDSEFNNKKAEYINTINMINRLVEDLERITQEELSFIVTKDFENNTEIIEVVRTESMADALSSKIFDLKTKLTDLDYNYFMAKGRVISLDPEVKSLTINSVNYAEPIEDYVDLHNEVIKNKYAKLTLIVKNIKQLMM